MPIRRARCAGRRASTRAAASVIALTRGLAKDVGQNGIYVNSVPPGGVDAEMTRGTRTQSRATGPARVDCAHTMRRAAAETGPGRERLADTASPPNEALDWLHHARRWTVVLLTVGVAWRLMR